jgi:hypothetical protein
MASGQIMPRGDDAKKVRRAKQLREAVNLRAKEKGIPLAEALDEILKEGNFVGFSAEQSRAIQTLESDRTAGKGWGRDAFARKVNERKQQLMRLHPELSPRDAFLRAADLMARADRHALSDYRSDVETV